MLGSRSSTCCQSALTGSADASTTFAEGLSRLGRARDRGRVEVELPGLALAGNDHRLDPPSPRPAPSRRTGVASVTYCLTRVSSAGARYRTLVVQGSQRK